MPSPELFAEPEQLFSGVGALRDRFTAAAGGDAVPVVSLSHPGANEALAMLASLATALPSSMMTQLEIAARLVSLGALDVTAADSCPVEGD